MVLYIAWTAGILS